MSQNEVKSPKTLRKLSDTVIEDELNFLNSSDFPYKLRLLDQSTNQCFFCDKQINYTKSSEKTCKGCELAMVDAPFK